MKDFLSTFMHDNKKMPSDVATQFTELFAETVHAAHRSLGARPFHIRSGLNAAVCDSVLVAFARGRGNVPADVAERYKRLIQSGDFLACVGSGTTDEDVVGRRLKIAQDLLFGER
jgi:hypothetical protein